MKKYIALFLSFIIVLNIIPISAEEYHTHQQMQINAVKRNIKNGIEPWAGAYSKLKATLPRNVMTGVPTIFQIPRDDAVIANNHRNIISNNAQTSYWHALVYLMEDNIASADIVVSILNAWSKNNIEMKSHDINPLKKYDTQLVAATTGVGLVYAAELIDGYAGWTYANREIFKAWVRNVLLPCVNGARNRTNNWASWSIYASAVCNDYLGDEVGFAENTSYLKNNIDSQIDSLGRMPEELKRDLDENGNSIDNYNLNGIKGLWYTYYSLAPITAHAQLILNRTGENLFEYESEDDKGSIKSALDRLLIYVNDFEAYNPKLADPNYEYIDYNMIPYPTSIWPANLYETMSAVYQNMDYYDFIRGDDKRPIEYDQTRLGFVWMFATMLKQPNKTNPYTAKISYIEENGISYAEAQIVNNSTDVGKKILFVTASYNKGKMIWLKSQVITLNDGLKHTARQEILNRENTKSFLIDLSDMLPVLSNPVYYIDSN